MINEWPSTIYSLSSIITLVEEKTRTTMAHPNLSLALAKYFPNIKSIISYLLLEYFRLYMYDKQFDKALHIYLQLRHGNVFQLIKDYNLYSSIGDKVLFLSLSQLFDYIM